MMYPFDMIELKHISKKGEESLDHFEKHFRMHHLNSEWTAYNVFN